MRELLFMKRRVLPGNGNAHGTIRFIPFELIVLQLLMIIHKHLGKSLQLFYSTGTFIFLLFLIQSKGYTQGTDLQRKIPIDQLQREYLIHLPPGYSSTGIYPVIFALHGGGGNYENTPALYNLNTVADKYNFIVVYPNAINKSWCMKGVGGMANEQDIDDVKFISVLMDTLVRNYHADSASFFCTGLSRGGIFSFFLVSKLSGRFKAIAPVCASIPLSIADTYTFYPTSVLLINGTDDPLLPFDGGHGSISRSKRNEENHFISTHDLVHKIKTLNTCPEISIAHPLPNHEKGDKCTAVKTTYQCSGTRFVFIKVNNGGHTWPGGQQYLSKDIIGKVCQDFKAEEEIVNFFMAVK
ncbi:MAG: putative esterase [Chitinophagaceae bacterium]|nr:putative esterase [Chitinophagaceae bacterium]